MQKIVESVLVVLGVCVLLSVVVYFAIGWYRQGVPTFVFGMVGLTLVTSVLTCVLRTRTWRAHEKL